VEGRDVKLKRRIVLFKFKLRGVYCIVYTVGERIKGNWWGNSLTGKGNQTGGEGEGEGKWDEDLL